jgi:hypothetical protein
MPICLHNSTNHAHLEDLKGRLGDHLARAPRDPFDPSSADAVIGALSDVVQAMDQGSVTADQARMIFGSFRIPGFSFDRWLAEMIDEGVYVPAMDRAA